MNICQSKKERLPPEMLFFAFIKCSTWNINKYNECFLKKFKKTVPLKLYLCYTI